MIRLLFTTNKNPFSYVIRLVTWSQWSHVAFVCEDGSVIESMAPHGVRHVSFEKAISKAKKYCVVEFMNADPVAMQAAMETQIGKSYDYLGALGIGLRVNIGHTDKWSCGEFICWAAEKIGSGIFRKSENRKISQEDLWRRNPVGKTFVVKEGQWVPVE